MEHIQERPCNRGKTEAKNRPLFEKKIVCANTTLPFESTALAYTSDPSLDRVSVSVVLTQDKNHTALVLLVSQCTQP